MARKQRLDRILVMRGLAGSRERARALILAGQVLVNDHCVDKAGTQVPEEAAIRIRGATLPYVSRGGLKLESALNHFQLDVQGRVALDVGASTGGFTDCLLQHGARRVYAVDVGYGQLAWSLREDPRVVNLERQNIRSLDAALLDETPDLAVIDASFIGLAKVLPPTLVLLDRPAGIIALIKPQFEVGKGRVGKGGIVKDPRLHEQVVAAVSRQAEELGCHVEGVVESSLTGARGNREFLIYLTIDAM